MERAIRKGRDDIAEEIERELDLPDLPVEMNDVWGWWIRIRSRKAPGYSGFVPIEWPDIDAFARLSGEAIEPAEIELIELLDNTFLEAQAKGASEADTNQSIKDGLKAVANG